MTAPTVADDPVFHSGKPGLNKREYFAAMAMQGICGSPPFDCESDVNLAVRYADALIEALNAERKP